MKSYTQTHTESSSNTNRSVNSRAPPLPDSHLLTELVQTMDLLHLVLGNSENSPLDSLVPIMDLLPPDHKMLVYGYNLMRIAYKNVEAEGISDCILNLKESSSSVESVLEELMVLPDEFMDMKEAIKGNMQTMHELLTDLAQRAKGIQIANKKPLQLNDVQMELKTAVMLVKPSWSVRNRLHALDVLQQLVVNHWNELTTSTCLIQVVKDLLCEDSEQLKAPILTLINEMLHKLGLSLWKELYPIAVSAKERGPMEAELACSILKWLPTDVGNQTDRLCTLAKYQPDLLDKHYRRYKSLKDTKGAEQHGIAIKSALNAVNAYAVWASLEELYSCNLVTGCAILLPEFRDEASEFFRVISLRNRPVDAVPGYDDAMNFILEQLERASVLATPVAVVGMTVCADDMREEKGSS